MGVPLLKRVCLVRRTGRVRRVPRVEALCHYTGIFIFIFFIGMTTGDVEKGGSRAARAKDWYASPMWGKSQAEMFGTLSAQDQ